MHSRRPTHAGSQTFEMRDTVPVDADSGRVLAERDPWVILLLCVANALLVVLVVLRAIQ